MSSASKPAPPALPAAYVVPEVWTAPEGGGMNRPTAGARFEKGLPRGEHPLQLYSLGTPNGQKVAILLEELGVKYDAWKIAIMEEDQFGSGFTEVNPNSKIPGLLDYSYDPPVRVFETGSILKYLAEKEGRLVPKDHHKKTECYNWLMWQMGTAPFIGGGFGHFYKSAPIKIEYAINRYAMETKRIFDVLDKHLEGKEYVCDDEYSIADIAILPWISVVGGFYGAGTFLGLDQYKNVMRWMDVVKARDAVQRGMNLEYKEF